MAVSGRKKENFIILEEIYHENEPKGRPKLSLKGYLADPKRTEKLLCGAIVFFGLAALVLGFFQFRYNVVKNFLPQKGSEIAQNDPNDLLGLKQKDTDGDGLSDYDELNNYGTSPYLKDSDSDGIDDAQEIAAGSDPNCPAGQNCFATWNETTATSSSASPSDLLFTGQSQASQLRQLLRQAGMSQSDLDNFSDDELLQAYQEILNQSQAAAGTSGSQATNVNSGQNSQPAKTVELPASQLSDLTPAQVRQLLLDSGISKDILDKTTDQDLMNLVKETLNQQ